MSIKSFVAAARLAHPLTPQDELEQTFMFNLDCTPFADGEELPPAERAIGDLTYYPNRGAKRSPTWLLYTIPITPSTKHQQYARQSRGAKCVRGDHAVDTITGLPGSAERIKALENFYCGQTEDTARSAFDIPSFTDDEVFAACPPDYLSALKGYNIHVKNILD